jgi:predicted transcriptional regulator
MASGEGRVTLSAAVPIELKERVQEIAQKHRWTLSQTIVVFLEEYLDEWEQSIDKGFNPTQKPVNKGNKRKKD